VPGGGRGRRKGERWKVNAGEDHATTERQHSALTVPHSPRGDRARLRREAMRRYLGENPDRAVPAIEIARRLGIGGLSTGRENLRRRVREVARELREQDGVSLCADHHPDGGYWLARSGGEWRRYLEAKRMAARFKFVSLRRMSVAVSERNSGQMRLGIGGWG